MDSCTHVYDDETLPCTPVFQEGTDDIQMQQIKAYLTANGDIYSFLRDEQLKMYYKVTNPAHSGHPINPLKVYQISYWVYLLDGDKTNPGTKLDERSNLVLQPYLGPYKHRLPGFGAALALLLYPTRADEWAEIDFFLTSNNAFAQCGWAFSPFGVKVPPNTPLRFIVRVLHSE